MISDKELYQVIADELKSKTMDAALWTQATAAGEGAADKTEVAYIRLRFQDLKRSALQQTSAVPRNNTPLMMQGNTELAQLRTALAKRLQMQGRTSLYSTLALQPEASDEIVATAITDFETRHQGGHTALSAEFKYARDTLGDPALREQYDRKLFSSLANDMHTASRSYSADSVNGGYSAMESSRMPHIIGILFIGVVGYLGLDYYKEKNKNDIQQKAVETVREISQSTVDTNQLRTQADIDLRNQAMHLEEERQRQELELRSNATNRLLEQQRLDQERRVQADQQRLAAQQAQAESMRASREKQYYACMNQQLLSQRDATSADAYARCAAYR